MTIWSVLCPSSSATVRRSTPAITSLLAKVWRLQCQVYPSIFASSRALGNQPRDPWSACRFARKDRHRFHPLASTVQFLQGGDCDRVEGDRSRVSVLCIGKVDLPAFEVDLTLIEAVLFAHPHPGMDGQKK
jgi:hypothetical protein